MKTLLSNETLVFYTALTGPERGKVVALIDDGKRRWPSSLRPMWQWIFEAKFLTA